MTFNTLYDQPTGTNGAQFMGVYQHQLFVNLSGDGLFAVDVTDPAHPFGRGFLRTLGWGTHVAFAGNSAYVASFIGMAPASNPRLLTAVVVDEPQSGSIYGGRVAAPAFGEIMSYALSYLGIPPG